MLWFTRKVRTTPRIPGSCPRVYTAPCAAGSWPRNGSGVNKLASSTPRPRICPAVCLWKMSLKLRFVWRTEPRSAAAVFLCGVQSSQRGSSWCFTALQNKHPRDEPIRARRQPPAQHHRLSEPLHTHPTFKDLSIEFNLL